MKQANTDFKFSIVSAVYNVENYLSEAIESIINQDIGFKDSVELILVDDGSSDHSGKICDEYQKKYPENIKVIHKSNGGVASARNAGIAIANGRYINFMDSDDKLTPDTLSAVYDFFIRHEQEIDLVSVPIYYFEQKTEPHRLNYKYASGKAQVIDLNDKYSYVQMSSASAFFKTAVLNSDPFDTSLRYAEDSKAIMKLLLDNPRYGIVPQGRYLYRARSTMDSALNGSKQHREWYIDCLKNYIFWALNEAKAKFGKIPEFVQYNIMYDLQGRFKVDEIPASVLTSNEKEIFMKMLFDAVFQIDDHIILEQKNLSKELKDYILSIKKAPDSGALQFDDQQEDAYFHYSDLNTANASSYQLRLKGLEILENDIIVKGAAKIYLRFPYPSRLYLRITSGSNIQTVNCCFHEDSDNVFRFDSRKLAVFLNFTAALPVDLISTSCKIEFCIDIDGHTVCSSNLYRMPDFPLLAGKQELFINDKKYIVSLNSEQISIERATSFTKLKIQTISSLRKIHKKCKSILH